jgi:rod shape-determining protein MreC
LQSINNTIDRHFFQASTIDDLKDKLQAYERNHLVMKKLNSEIHDLYKLHDSNMSLSPDVQLVRAISYQQFGNFNRLWIDIADYNSSQIYGLTHKEIVAGIVVSANGKALGLLNKDPKCAYSVYVGATNAPGIAHGDNGENIVVDFIPTWFKINKGDEVSTSGLDNIFFKGLKVGKVVSVRYYEGYQKALVRPYYQANEPSYFYAIKDVR